jgi:hypothetical protein
MQRSIIEKHIADFDYIIALKFIEEHKDESFANRYLKMTKTSFSEKKVIQFLSAWIEELPMSEDLTKSNHIVSSTDIDVLIEQRNELLIERDYLRSQLENIPSDEERLRVATKILQFERQKTDIWQDINLLRAGKELPQLESNDRLSAVFEGVTDPLKIKRIRDNHISYMSKAKKGERPIELIPFYQAVISKADQLLYGTI